MSRNSKAFTPALLLERLPTMPGCRRYLVGFSGGADSTALLLALKLLATAHGKPIVAVHFNHGLQSQAGDWESFCREFCRQQGIELVVHRLSLQSNPGSSPETNAREARYAVIGKLIEKDDIYLTAHHADDQAETILLNLLRGSGAAGLTGIPRLRRFGYGWLARPLLQVRRTALQDWLESQGAPWINDMSNQDDSMDRNFLRSCILPQLDQRWPGVVMRLYQAAEHLHQRSEAFRELLSRFPGLGSANGFTLDLAEFSQVSPELQAEILRNWTHQRGAPPPPRARLLEFLAQLDSAGSGSHAELSWRGWLIRHHKGKLWMHQLPGPPPCPDLEWTAGDHLELGNPHGQLRWRGKPEAGPLRARICSRANLADDMESTKSNRKKIKEIMRLSGVPDWLRDAIPLLFVEGQLIAIGDWWFSKGMRKLIGHSPPDYHWQVEDPLLKQVQSDCHICVIDPDATLV